MKRYILSAKSDFATDLDNVKNMHIMKRKSKIYTLNATTNEGRTMFLGRYSSKKVACRALEKVLDWVTDDYSIINVPTEQDVRLCYMN